MGVGGTRLQVREAALTAVMSILEFPVFEAGFTGDNFSSRGDDTHAETAAALRSYWSQYGHLEKDERFMKILTDPKAKPEAWRLAAERLGMLGEVRAYGTTVWTDRVISSPPGENPAVRKFADPAAAEAVLAAFDREQVLFQPKMRAMTRWEQRDAYREFADVYVDALVGLGDKRASKDLSQRFLGEDSISRRTLWAYACQKLGDHAPFVEMAQSTEKGTVTLSRYPQEARADFAELIRLFVLSARTEPSCDSALRAIAKPTHPLYPRVRETVLSSPADDYGEWDPSASHPFFLEVLQNELTSPTQADDSNTNRVRAAEIARNTVWGIASTDDPPETIAKNLSRFRQSLVGRDVVPHFHWEIGRASFAIAPKPLDRPATPDDVSSGRALFHLGGNGWTVEFGRPLPALVYLHETDDYGHSIPAILVQVEKSERGNIVCGVVTEKGTKTLSLHDLQLD